MPQVRERLDQRVVREGLAPTRAKAAALIQAGYVLVDDQLLDKPGTQVPATSVVRLKADAEARRLSKYVARSAHKLIAGLDAFGINPRGWLCLDIGASTGGFTQVLLEREARQVIAIDVGTNQLAWEIRNDPRVISHERTNAKALTKGEVPEPPDLVVVDVSFISLAKVIQPTVALAKPETLWVTLIKPQFEVGRDEIGKGGIVTNPVAAENAVQRLTDFAQGLGLRRLGLIKSPITGTDGNEEYLAHWKKS